MNVRRLLDNIEAAREQGLQFAIHAPGLGMWTTSADRFAERDGALYWEHGSGRTYLVPSEMCWLEFLPAPKVDK